MNIQKELQNRIGELIGKDYFKLEFGQKINISNCPNSTFIKFDSEYIYWLDKDMNSCDDDSALLNELNLEIIGQEPSLNDVLMAIENKYKDEDVFFSLRTDGDLIKHRTIKDDYILNIDLSKSLFQQSEKTLQAIYNLLK